MIRSTALTSLFNPTFARALSTSNVQLGKYQTPRVQQFIAEKSRSIPTYEVAKVPASLEKAFAVEGLSLLKRIAPEFAAGIQHRDYGTPQTHLHLSLFKGFDNTTPLRAPDHIKATRWADILESLDDAFQQLEKHADHPSYKAALAVLDYYNELAKAIVSDVDSLEKIKLKD